MKKVLWSAAIALFILILTGCAGTAGSAPTEDRPSQTTVENVPNFPAPVEKEQFSFSAGNTTFIEDDVKNEDVDSDAEPVPTTEPDPIPAPQEPAAPKAAPAPVQQTVILEPAVPEKAEENTIPAPVTPEPEITQVPTAPTEPEPPAEPEPPEPAFSIDHWIAYAQNYARGAGLNLDTTVVDCWDNPISAGAHCRYLERDIQSRLNRYAKDETITDVWIWAENRSDGSYDLYIGYA